MVGRYKVDPSSLFTDTILLDIARAQPQTISELQNIPGVDNPYKINLYGSGVLDVIKRCSQVKSQHFKPTIKAMPM